MDSLNTKQQKAVDELDENVLLLASAGTGKTKALTLRIANIINTKRAVPEEVLCLTFTNRACKEMKERVIDTIGLKGTEVFVSTFHSFCFDIIKTESKKNMDIATDFTVFDEEDCKELLKEFNTFNLPINALQNFVDYMKEQSVELGITDYRELFRYIKNNKFIDINKLSVDSNYRPHSDVLDFIMKFGDRLVEEYNKALHERHGLDFNDLLIEVNHLFKNEDISNAWRSKFKYIHIDEVQDTSEVEYDIISKLFSKNNIMMCGDYFQTIYEWRGSNPTHIFNKFKRDYSPITIIFDENYRATQVLLEASEGYLKNAFKDESDKAYSNEIKANSATKGEKIILKNAYNLKEEAEWIFKTIKDLNIEDISKIAILTRSNKTNIALSGIFERENSLLSEKEQVKFLLVDDFKFFRRQEIKDIISYIKFSINKFDNNSLKRIIKRAKIGIGDKTIEKIEHKDMRKLGVRLSDFVDINTHELGDPYKLLLDEIENRNVIVFDVESTGVNTTEDEIVQIAGVRINKYGEEVERFERFLRPNKTVGQSELIHGFSDEFLNEEGEDSCVVLTEFLKFIEGSIIVGHNVSFDISILKSELERLKLLEPNYLDYYDTLDISRRFYPNLPNHKLENLSIFFKTDVQSDHNAMNDVLSTKDVLIKMIDENIRATAKERVDAYKNYIDKFTELYEGIIDLRNKTSELRPSEIIKEIINNSNLLSFYEEGSIRIDNIKQFYKFAQSMDDKSMSSLDSLNELLKITSLSNSEMDRILEKQPQVPIITVHQAKGAEFDHVFLAGLQQYNFPTYQSIKSHDLSEEKRVFYVAMTRAKKQLYLSWHSHDRDKVKQRSQFIDYIPREYIKEE